MNQKIAKGSLVDVLSRQLEGKPVRCMAIAQTTGERCQKLATRTGTPYCGYHRLSQKAVPA